jgi:hypothetical protein
MITRKLTRWLALPTLLTFAAPGPAQYEPWEYTALREAMRQDVPDAGLAVRALKRWRKDDLSHVWLKWLGKRAKADLFDALADCCGVADSPMSQDFARQRAKVYLTLMAQIKSDEQIERSAGTLVDRLGALSTDERRLLREFVLHSKARSEKK